MKIIETKNLTRIDLINTAVFGAVWGLAEISLGALMHSSKIPFRGTIMSSLAVVIIITAKALLKYKGSLILLGGVTAMLRLSMGIGFNITPFAAIIIESVIAEIIFDTIGFRKVTAVIAGAVILLYTLIHGMIMQVIFLGVDIYSVYYEIIIKITSSFSIPESYIIIFITLFALTHIIMGGVIGGFGYSVGAKAEELMKTK